MKMYPGADIQSDHSSAIVEFKTQVKQEMNQDLSVK